VFTGLAMATAALDENTNAAAAATAPRPPAADGEADGKSEPVTYGLLARADAGGLEKLAQGDSAGPVSSGGDG
jgi:hypothetical protein